MTELKAFDVWLGRYTEDGSPCVVAFDDDRNPRLLNEKVYLKSEADKVIAEKDKEIAELRKERDWLAKDRAQAYDDLEKRAQLNIKQDAAIAELKRACNSKDDWCLHTLKENRHHKYNRCLAMWLYLRECYWRCKHHNEKTRADWYEKWMDIFKKLAEKFKEAK